MRLKSISLIGIVFIFSLCLCRPFSFAQCPPDYPVDCGNDWCCDTIANCPTNDGFLDLITCIRKKTCLSVAIFGEDSEEVELLRYIRDNVLSQTPEGQEIIRLYYQWSPVIVKTMEEDEEFKEEVRQIVDEVLSMIEEE